MAAAYTERRDAIKRARCYGLFVYRFKIHGRAALAATLCAACVLAVRGRRDRSSYHWLARSPSKTENARHAQSTASTVAKLTGRSQPVTPRMTRTSKKTRATA